MPDADSSVSSGAASLARRDAWLSPRSAGLACLFVTILGWGLNWPVMKIVLADWPPLFARGVSGLVAAGLLTFIAVVRGESLAVPPGVARRLGLAALLNVFVWMGFSTLAMLWLKVGEGALLVYTMPIWATLFAWPILGVRPTGRGFAALLLGLAGVATLLVGPDLAIGVGKLPGVVLALGAAILFGLGTVTARTPLPMPPLAVVAWQVGLGCLPMIVLGVLFEKPDLRALGVHAAFGMTYMAIVPMGLCYLSWFATLKRLPPATAATGMLLVPIVGVTAAAFVLGETLGAREVAAFVLTLTGVGLALKRT